MDDDQSATLAEAITELSQLLAAIQAAGREPDAWEAEHVAYAIGCAATGWSFAALNLARKAGEPADKTAGDRARGADTPTLAALQAGLNGVNGSMKH